MNKQEIRLPTTKCVGCGLCVSRCTGNAITMQTDEKGFLYPIINEKMCVRCGLCVRDCIALNQMCATASAQCFAVKSANDKDRACSSSGGVFSVLAKTVVKSGGVVFGAACDERGNVCHVQACDERALKPLLGSKYVQSRFDAVYEEAERALEEDRMVLICGTPCQIAAARARFGECENLILVDFLCHGVGSPAVFLEYVKARLNDQPATAIFFRNKAISTKAYAVQLCSKKKDYLKYHWDDLYMRGYLENLFLRPACYDCSYTHIAADITLGDFFDVSSYIPGIEDRLGVSKMFCNTQQGSAFFEKVKDNLIFRSVALPESEPQSKVGREKSEAFFQSLKTKGVLSALRKHTAKISFKVWLYRRIHYRLRRGDTKWEKL